MSKPKIIYFKNLAIDLNRKIKLVFNILNKKKYLFFFILLGFFLYLIL